MVQALLLLFVFFVHCDSYSSKIAFGSCFFPNQKGEILNTIVDRSPDIFLHLGDVTYLDYKELNILDPATIFSIKFGGFPEFTPDLMNKWKETWNKTKSNKYYQRLLNEIPYIMGTWDDHDFGFNDANGLLFTNSQKNYSQNNYLDFWNVPKNDPKRDRDGLYDYYPMEIDLGNENIQIIDIIIVDTRYFSKVDGDENLLGDIQWNWFENILRHELHGILTIIATSIQFLPISRDKDNWGSKYSESQIKLLKLLNTYNINTKRIIFISGDIHRGEILQMQCLNTLTEQKRDIFEITSSGLTHTRGTIETFIHRQNELFADYVSIIDGIYKCKYWGKNFGEINIDWNDDGSGDIDNIYAKIMDINGNEQCSINIPLWNEPDDTINYDENKFILSKFDDNYVCYGGVKQYDDSEISKREFVDGILINFGMAPVLVFIIYIILTIFLSICKCLKCCGKCTVWFDKKL